MTQFDADISMDEPIALPITETTKEFVYQLIDEQEQVSRHSGEAAAGDSNETRRELAASLMPESPIPPRRAKRLRLQQVEAGTSQVTTTTDLQTMITQGISEGVSKCMGELVRLTEAKQDHVLAEMRAVQERQDKADKERQEMMERMERDRNEILKRMEDREDARLKAEEERRRAEEARLKREEEKEEVRLIKEEEKAKEEKEYRMMVDEQQSNLMKAMFDFMKNIQGGPSSQA